MSNTKPDPRKLRRVRRLFGRTPCPEYDPGCVVCEGWKLLREENKVLPTHNFNRHLNAIYWDVYYKDEPPHETETARLIRAVYQAARGG